jgi:hypothetical protein
MTAGFLKISTVLSTGGPTSHMQQGRKWSLVMFYLKVLCLACRRRKSKEENQSMRNGCEVLFKERNF